MRRREAGRGQSRQRGRTWPCCSRCSAAAFTRSRRCAGRGEQRGGRPPLPAPRTARDTTGSCMAGQPCLTPAGLDGRTVAALQQQSGWCRVGQVGNAVQRAELRRGVQLAAAPPAVERIANLECRPPDSAGQPCCMLCTMRSAPLHARRAGEEPAVSEQPAMSSQTVEEDSDGARLSLCGLVMATSRLASRLPSASWDSESVPSAARDAEPQQLSARPAARRSSLRGRRRCRCRCCG